MNTRHRIAIRMNSISFLKVVSVCLLSISLFGCSQFAGNVVPNHGATMEMIYDEVEPNTPNQQTTISKKINRLNGSHELAHRTSTALKNHDFYKIPNPELTLYVFPHLAGHDQIPIPGYNTVFNAYTEDHYVLRREG